MTGARRRPNTLALRPLTTRLAAKPNMHPGPRRYILGYKGAYDYDKGKGGYVTVYYRGSNDAWDGCGTHLAPPRLSKVTHLPHSPPA